MPVIPIEELKKRMNGGIPMAGNAIDQARSNIEPSYEGSGFMPTGIRVKGLTFENPSAKAMMQSNRLQAAKDIKTRSAQKNVMQSAESVAGAMGRLAKGWADAYQEGGVGRADKDIWARANIRFGGDRGDKYRKTSALPGLKTEIIARMMPLMTQQGDKEGSVRLVESVFRKLEETLPKGYSGPGAARDQMSTTMENMFGFAKAFHDLGIGADQVNAMSDEQFSEYIGALETAKNRVTFAPQEKKVLNQITKKTLAPIDQILNKNASSFVKGKVYQIPQKGKFRYIGNDQWEKA